MSPFPRWGHAWGSDCRLILKGLLVALSTLVMSGTSVHAQTVGAQRIVVRSYNTIGVALPMLEHAESTLGELLRDAGIESSWRNCRTTDGPSSQSSDGCDDVLNPSEVIVRIVRASRANTDVEVLGYAHVDPYRRQGTLATVFADRVRALAAALGIDDATLLGRAMAHEVGHLLLGTLNHSATGLMRGEWNTAGRRSDWFFSSSEVMLLHDGLVARSGRQAIAVARAHGSQ